MVRIQGRHSRRLLAVFRAVGVSPSTALPKRTHRANSPGHRGFSLLSGLIKNHFLFSTDAKLFTNHLCSHALPTKYVIPIAPPEKLFLGTVSAREACVCSISSNR